MAIRKAFLSSTGKDLAEYRQATFEAINGLDGWKCVRMEDFGARTRPPDAFDADAVRGCDLFIGILGHCYGTIPRGRRRSYTEQEYDTAVTLNLPRLMFIAPDDFPLPARLRESENYWKRQQAFRTRAQTDQLPGRFSTPASLANEVLQAIRNWEEEERREQEKKPEPDGLAEPTIPSFTVPPARRDWLAALVSYPVSVFEDVFALLTGPKRFIAQRSFEGRLTTGRALGFLAATYGIRIPIPPHIHSIPADVASDILFVIAEVSTWWVVLFLAWRCVGGSSTMQSYLPIHLYYSAIYMLLAVLVNRFNFGVMRFIDQQIYEQLMAAVYVKGVDLKFMIDYGDKLGHSPAFLWFSVATTVSWTTILLWFVAGWGAYRTLNNASRLRSTVAALVFLILGIPATGVLTAVAEALIAELQ